MTEETQPRRRFWRPKETWGPGPWQNEPDDDEFEHAGFQCKLHRGPPGQWNGYVVLPEGHPLHDKSYNEPGFPDVEVHGGLTFAGCLAGDPRWLVGFDCNHFGDLAPGHLAPEWDGEYRTIEYARAETMKLAEQFAGSAREDDGPAVSDFMAILRCLARKAAEGEEP